MLKVIMLRKKLSEVTKKLTEAREKAKELATREKELEAAIEEAQTDEEKEAVAQEVEQYEKDKEENDESVRTLEKEVSDTESELAELESKQRQAEPVPEARMRGVETVKTTRKKFFGMTVQERDAFFARDDVHAFLERVRTLGTQNRAITGAELTIPSVMLDLLRENIEEYSKLYKHVRVQSVPGKARQTIQGTIPEAVWTEMNAAINELSLVFNDAEVDGYKVAGYMVINNAVLKDSDIDLASTIITSLGQSIGLALDKAILYGTSKKMPTGVVTRLAQAAKPETYPDTAREWKNLSSSNIVSIAAAKKGVDLFKEIVIASGNAKGKYSTGNRFWAMNETTKTKLVAEALSFNAAGAIATGMGDTMPIVGGAIETLDFIPDNVIVGGYGDLYLLAEREGAQITQSEHVKFLEDQTVYKGLARYDGLPVIAEGFVAIGILGTTPAADMTFAEDTANKAAASSKE
ncbi:phage major capsid protein [Coprococcus sp. CLA-AA-H212]|jgi:HK97 family phage major capsid protein|uniref:Phage major capsid protein n=1 Tax=Coprococcus hominis (ex Arizal et al. 2022) TaxID=2881262 RepID=A0ABS8FQS6_9FIRM|nr:phage major capsid protein [Coprococcus hominis (ex Arizal et al. 2022)]MCC2219566.1 phage major capsid protein [Coprococcus hominis (ex Arizal et al. 2022)]DAH09156.1 MAG TPA: major capsid protein [Caudoviricetes sp.]